MPLSPVSVLHSQAQHYGMYVVQYITYNTYYISPTEEAIQSQSSYGHHPMSNCAHNFRTISGLYVTTQHALICIQYANGCSRTSEKLTCAWAGPDATIQPVLGCPGYGLQPCITGTAFQSHLHACSLQYFCTAAATGVITQLTGRPPYCSSCQSTPVETMSRGDQATVGRLSSFLH